MSAGTTTISVDGVDVDVDVDLDVDVDQENLLVPRVRPSRSKSLERSSDQALERSSARAHDDATTTRRRRTKIFEKNEAWLKLKIRS